MNQILRFLFDNPILILILVGWLFSALAGAATKAAKRQAQGQPRGQARPRPEFDAVRDRQRQEQAAMAQQAQAEQAQKPGDTSRPRTPDDIARELRRMLGLESGPERQPAPVPPAEEARTSAWDRHTGDDEDLHVPTVAAGELRKRPKLKRAAPSLLKVAKVRAGSLLEHHAAKSRRPGMRRVAFDRKHAISAVIGMEVLGAPRAVRAYRGPNEDQ